VSFIPPPPAPGAKKEVIRYWFDRARAMTRRLFAEWPQNANLELQHVGGLEAMIGLGWLQGYGGHEAFHHRQIKRVIAQLEKAELSTH
jgi:hypothetical protein